MIVRQNELEKLLEAKEKEKNEIARELKEIKKKIKILEDSKKCQTEPGHFTSQLPKHVEIDLTLSTDPEMPNTLNIESELLSKSI